MRIAAALAENEKKIVQQASKQLWQKPRFHLLAEMPMESVNGLYAYATTAGTHLITTVFSVTKNRLKRLV